MNKIKIVIIVLLLVVAINALIAGYSFIVDPDGSGLMTSVELLAHSPFHDFLIPGIILFTVNGLLNVLAAMSLLRGWRYAYLFVAFQGMLLTGWIVVQVIMLAQFNALHAIFGAIGLFFLFTGLKLYGKVKTIKVTCDFQTGKEMQYEK